MGRARALSEGEVGQVRVLHELGNSEREIASIVGRSKTVVHNCIVQGESYNQNYTTGRPKVTTERDERRMVRLATQQHYSIHEIAQVFQNKFWGVVHHVICNLQMAAFEKQR